MQAAIIHKIRTAESIGRPLGLFGRLTLLWRLLRQFPYKRVGGGRTLPISADLAGRINEPLGLGFVVGLWLLHFADTISGKSVRSGRFFLSVAWKL